MLGLPTTTTTTGGPAPLFLPPCSPPPQLPAAAAGQPGPQHAVHQRRRRAREVHQHDHSDPLPMDTGEAQPLPPFFLLGFRATAPAFAKLLLDQSRMSRWRRHCIASALCLPRRLSRPPTASPPLCSSSRRTRRSPCWIASLRRCRRCCPRPHRPPDSSRPLGAIPGEPGHPGGRQGPTRHHHHTGSTGGQTHVMETLGTYCDPPFHCASGSLRHLPPCCCLVPTRLWVPSSFSPLGNADRAPRHGSLPSSIPSSFRSLCVFPIPSALPRPRARGAGPRLTPRLVFPFATKRSNMLRSQPTQSNKATDPTEPSQRFPPYRWMRRPSPNWRPFF